jgi:lipid II:glycine glycyltransferase (peptidoglycan interpeptide bridge formation enzyme)
VASKNGIPIAAIVTLRHRDVMTYKYGASDAAFHALGGMQLLLWTAISAAQDAGCAVFDMGRSDVNNIGEVMFKAHWGADRRPINYIRCPVERFTGNRMFTFSNRLARRFLSMLPARTFIAAGELLYPHMG